MMTAFGRAPSLAWGSERVQLQLREISQQTLPDPQFPIPDPRDPRFVHFRADVRPTTAFSSPHR